MRKPPSAGPSTVLWIAMMAFRPASLLWQKTTCSWPDVARVSKIIADSAAGREMGSECLFRIVWNGDTAQKRHSDPLSRSSPHKWLMKKQNGRYQGWDGRCAPASLSHLAPPPPGPRRMGRA